MKTSNFKIVTIVGTRPEITRLAPTLRALDREFDHILVHTNQNNLYELNGIFFAQLGLRQPDYILPTKHGDLGVSLGSIIEETYRILAELKPQALLVLGDTNSALATINARRLHIPILHLEAGHRNGSWETPETTNRMIVDHIANYNFPYTQIAHDNLVREGVAETDIFVTGSPILEVLNTFRKDIEKSSVLAELKISKDRFLLFSTHREENVDNPESLKKIVDLLFALVKRYQLPIIFPMHPRTKKQLEKAQLGLPPEVVVIMPLGMFDYLQLVMNAYVTISDSGTISEESALLNSPAVLLRDFTEHPEAIDHHTIAMARLEFDDVVKKSEKMRKILDDNDHRFPNIPPEYLVTNFSDIIIQKIRNIFGLLD